MKPMFLLLLMFCASFMQNTLAGDLTAIDYRVWSAFIGPGQAYVWHRIEPASLYDRREHFDGANAEYYRQAATTSNEEPMELRADLFNTKKKVILLDKKTLRLIIGRRPKPTWLLSPWAIDGASGMSNGVYRFSKPAYSDDGNTAYFLACCSTVLRGSVTLIVVEKDSADDWHLHYEARKDFVRWTAGTYFDE